jgi:hypothetical protein
MLLDRLRKRYGVMVWSDWKRLSPSGQAAAIAESIVLRRAQMPEPDTKELEREYEDLLRFEAML